MTGNLTGNKVQDTYKGLFHLDDASTGLTSSLASVYDGVGNLTVMTASLSAIALSSTTFTGGIQYFTETTEPATPASGQVAIFTKSDHNLYTKDSTGTVTNLTSGGSAVPTSRNINTTSPLTGGGNLTADRTLGINQALISIANTQVTGLGTLSTQSGTFSGTSSGTNTGDQTITLTGGVTGSGTGSFATTIRPTGSNGQLIGSASGSNTIADITLGTNLSLSGSTLNAASAAASITPSAVAINTTLVAGDNGKLFVQSGSSTVFTLPDSVTAGNGWYVYIQSVASTTCNINRAGSDIIRSGSSVFSTYVLQSPPTSGNCCILIVNDGAGNFYVVSDNITVGSSKLALSNNGQTIDVTEANLTISNMGGTLAATHGGTGQATYTQGDLLYSSATNTLSKLGIGTANQYLMAQGAAANPLWQSLLTQVEIDFTSTLATDITVTVTDARVSTSSFILAQTSGATPSTRSADEAMVESLQYFAVPGTGNFTLNVRPLLGVTSGKFKVNYLVA